MRAPTAISSAAVEACLRPTSSAAPQYIQAALARFLEGRTIWYRDGPLDLRECEDAAVHANVLSVTISDTGK